MLFLIFFLGTCQCSFIILWGQPSDWGYCNQVDTTNWATGCLKKCESDSTCIVAYLKSSICYLCQAGQIKSFIVGTKSAGLKIAFRSTVTSCASSLLAKYTTSAYTLTRSGSSYTFAYTKSKSCLSSSNWLLSNRKNSVQWCLKLIQQSVNGYDGAVALCKKNGATLSGIQTAFEYQLLRRKAWTTFPTNKQSLILTDGFMKTDCWLKFMTREFVSPCRIANGEGWTWTDKYISDTSNYKWTTLNPHSGIYQTYYCSCIAYQTQKNSASFDGYFQSSFCYSSQYFSGVLCGKLAT